MKSWEWPKPMWHPEYPKGFPSNFPYPFLAANEQVYETAAQNSRKSQMDPEPPLGLWGWSKTYIPKTAYEVGQKRVMHGPKGATTHSASKEEEKKLLGEGWSLSPVEVTEEDQLTETQKQANELEEMRREMAIMREALSGREGKKGGHKDH